MKQIVCNGELIATITSMQDWINRVPDCLPKGRMAEQRIWLDANNNCLSIGQDFMIAQEIGSYPVRVYSLQRVAEFIGKEVKSHE